jgi:hypothetical protein
VKIGYKSLRSFVGIKKEAETMNFSSPIKLLVILLASFGFQWETSFAEDCMDLNDKAQILSQLNPSSSKVPRLLKGTNLFDGMPVRISMTQGTRPTLILFLSTCCLCSASHHDVLPCTVYCCSAAAV